MACCGKKIKSITKKLGNIMYGHVNLLVERSFRYHELSYEFTDERLQICRGCSCHTWLTAGEYIAFVKKHFGEVIKNLDDLSTLPPLPKAENGRGKKLFCRICKCYIPAKAAVGNEHCPEKKW